MGRVLSSGKEDGGEDVSGVGVESSDAASHGASDEVLLHVEVAQGVDGGLENALDDLSGDNSLSHNTLATTFDPVDSGRLLIGAVISGKSEDDHFGEVLRHDLERLFGALGNHVHSHGVTGGGGKSDVERATGHGDFERLQLSKARGGLEGLFKDIVTIFVINPLLRLGSFEDGREVDRGATSHSVINHGCSNTSTSIEGFAASRGRGNERPFGSGHRNREQIAIDFEGAGDTKWEGHITDDVLTASTDDPGVIVVGHWNVGIFKGLGHGGAG